VNGKRNSLNECSTGRKTRGRSIYEINAGAVIGLREIEHGLSAIKHYPNV